MRTVDTSKKSNIKCEHCEYWNERNQNDAICTNDKSQKCGTNTNYYNRCRAFSWSHSLNLKQKEK